LRAPLLIAAAVLAAVAGSRAAWAQKVVRDYTFGASLKDNAGAGPALKSLGGAVGDGVYEFAVGNGLQLEKTGVTDHYTIELTFRFDDVDGWQKIVDFKDRADDNGLYVLDGQLQFYNFGIGGRIEPSKDYVIRLERDRETKQVRGYVDGQRVFEFVDRGDDGVFQGENAFFFVDDAATTDEQASGSVKRIRIWDAPGGQSGV
jgi:hypothetical protein